MTKTKKLAALLLPFAVAMGATGIGFATANADEGEGETTPPVEETSKTDFVKFEDIPTAVNGKQFGMVEKTNFNYTVKASTDGGFDATKTDYNLVPFDTYDDSDRPMLTLSTTSGLEFRNWKWFFAARSTVVIVVESKISGTVEFDFSDCGNFGGWLENWNAQYTVNQYVAKTQTFTNVVSHRMASGKTIADGSFTQSATYNLTLEVAEGDVIYYEIGSNAAGRNVQNMTQAKIIATVIEEDPAVVYGKSLDEEVAAMTQAHYSDTAWAAIEKIVSDYKAGTYADLPAAKTAYDTASAAIKAVKPDTQTYYGDELDKAVAKLTETDYEAETWAAIGKIVTDFKAETFATPEALLTAYEEAKAEIEGTEKDAPEFIRADLLDKMNALYAGLTEANFEADDWTAITAIYDAYKAEQSGKTDISELKAYYDEQVAAIKAIKAVKQEISYLDVPTQMNANGYNWIEGDVFDIKYFTGSVKKGLKDFDEMHGSASAMQNKEIAEASGEAYYAETWRWFVGIDAGVIVAYRANQDCTVEIVSTRIANGGGIGWTNDTVLNVYIMRNGKAKSIGRIVAPSTDEDFSGKYYLKATDVLYVEFTTETATSSRNTQTPYAMKAYGDATAFDEEKYLEQNNDLPKEVTDRIEEQTAALNAYLETLKEEDYSATNWLQLQDYVTKFIEDCDTQVQTVDDVNALYNTILNQMKAVPDKAAALAELQGTLQGYVADLQAEYDRLIAENKYSKENKEKLDKILADGKANIEKATSKAAGNTQKSAAITAMKAVETSGKAGDGLSGGAIAGIVIAGVAVVAGVTVGVILGKKKKSGKAE